MQHSFTAQIDEWVLKSKVRMLAVFQTATQYVVEDMLDRTPVDTGYLRASLTVKFNTPAPIRPNNVPSEGATRNSYGMPTQYALAIAGSKIGQTIYASYTAATALPNALVRRRLDTFKRAVLFFSQFPRRSFVMLPNTALV